MNRDLVQMIREHGWALMGIMGDQTTPSFLYSVGAKIIGLPDLIMVGIGPVGKPIMNGILAAARKGLILQEGQLYDQFANLPLALKRVSPEQTRDWMLKTHGFYGALYPGEAFEVFQVVMPDVAGRFPWEPGYDLLPQVLLWEK